MKMEDSIEMIGVREYSEGEPVYLSKLKKDTYWDGKPEEEIWGSKLNGREVIVASNEGGYNCTQIDLLGLVEWLKNNRPELLE